MRQHSCLKSCIWFFYFFSFPCLKWHFLGIARNKGQLILNMIVWLSFVLFIIVLSSIEFYKLCSQVADLVAKLSWWKRKERERGRNMGMTCEEWLRYSTELCHWTHCSGIPYRPFTKMSPSSHLCSQSADRRPTLSHHISAWMFEDQPPDKHNLLF